jgi:hypothetical protein
MLPIVINEETATLVVFLFFNGLHVPSHYKCFCIFFVRLATYFKFHVGIPDFQIEKYQTKSQINKIVIVMVYFLLLHNCYIMFN